LKPKVTNSRTMGHTAGGKSDLCIAGPLGTSWDNCRYKCRKDRSDYKIL